MSKGADWMTAAKGSAARAGVTVVMDLLVAVAVVSLAQLVVSFFGFASSSSWGSALQNLTRHAVLPLGIAHVRTPYAGIFDANAAVTVVALLVVEWVLGLVRRNV